MSATVTHLPGTAPAPMCAVCRKRITDPSLRPAALVILVTAVDADGKQRDLADANVHRACFDSRVLRIFRSGGFQRFLHSS